MISRVAETTNSGCKEPAVAGGAAAGCAYRHFDFVGQMPCDLSERLAKPRCVIEQVGWTAIRPASGKWSEFGSRSRHQLMESTILRLSYFAFCFGIELRRDVFGQAERAGCRIDDDRYRPAIAPAPERIGDRLRHKRVAGTHGLADRLSISKGSSSRSRQRPAESTNAFRRARTTSGELPEAMVLVARRIATEDPIDACREIDGCRAVAICPRQGPRWPRHRARDGGKEIRAHDPRATAVKAVSGFTPNSAEKACVPHKRNARYFLDRAPVLGEAQRDLVGARAILARSEFLDQGTGIDPDRTGNGARSVAGASLDPVVLILRLQLGEHG